ncbi:unnamed protein product [Fusarium equiseti]|uniref:Uncharacterized protein n=1 Tax=Fusarium equiseti TaxID=61235 RepID=A0A8J2ND30_FUSEQ|nr:unnamed protein product [Fusarium equiseti]
MSEHTPYRGFDQAFDVPLRNEDLANRIHELAQSDRIKAEEEERSIRLGNFCITLDDTLLECLKEIRKARQMEDFDWVFVDDKLPFSKYKYALDNLDNAADLAIAQALSPSDRSLYSNEYGKKFYYRESSDNKGATLYEDPMPR